MFSWSTAWKSFRVGLARVSLVRSLHVTYVICRSVWSSKSATWKKYLPRCLASSLYTRTHMCMNTCSTCDYNPHLQLTTLSWIPVKTCRCPNLPEPPMTERNPRHSEIPGSPSVVRSFDRNRFTVTLACWSSTGRGKDTKFSRKWNSGRQISLWAQVLPLRAILRQHKLA